MMGRRRFAQKLYYQLSLDQLVPQDHLLRRIAEAVDFSFVRPLCCPFYSHTGQPSVDPVVLFKMLLVGYLYGITSERRLAQEVELHLAYRWFLGYDLDEPTPNHSVLSKARARFAPEVFEGFFRQSIALCREAGLLAEGPVYIDSTLIQAAASLASLRQSGELAQPPLSVPEYVRRLYQENGEVPRDEPPVSQPEPSLPDQPLSPPSGESHPDRRQRRANNELQSRTDPDASVISRRGFGLHLAYKAHVAVAGQCGRVITAAIATSGATADEHLLGEVLWEHRRLSGLPVSEVVADGKYGTVANYVYLRKAGIRAFIPPRRHGYQANGVWGRDRFRWLPEEDSFLCPAEQRLRRFTTVTTTRRIGYRAPKGICAGCRFRSQCAPSGRQRTVSRFWDQDAVEEALELTSIPLGRQRLRERKVRAEGVFGLAKELHGLRRTRLRGRWKVQIQLWLTATAMNVKRAVATMSRGTPAAAGAVAALPAVIRRIRRLLALPAASATAPVHW